MLNPCSAQRWAESLGIDRSELVREALRRRVIPRPRCRQTLRRCAVCRPGRNVDVIVSGDNDLLEWEKQDPRVVTPSQFERRS